MSVTTKVLMENETMKVMQFMWSKPISVADLENREIIEDALEQAISSYVTDENYVLYSVHNNPLLRLLGRIIIINQPVDFPEIITKM